MKSYLTTLTEQADSYDVSLLKAFKHASIPTSTYYRAQLSGQIRYETALRVFNAIEKLHVLQQAREHTQGLRASSQRVNRRSVRAKFKPRVVSS
jgi:hypothetical protein